MKTDPRTGVAMVLGAAALWGTTGTAQALAGGELASVWFGALRLAVATAFFAVYAALTTRRDHLAAAGRPRVTSVLVAGVGMAAYNLAFFAGVRDIGVAVGTAIALGSGPLWAGLLQAVVARQPPRAIWWLGTALAVAGGVLLTAGSGQASAPVGSRGVLLCLLSGLSYAIYTLVNKRMVATAPAAKVTLYAFATAAALAVPAAWLDSGMPTLRMTDSIAVVYVGVITAGVSYLLFSHALRHISAGTAVTLALGEPVMAFALAVAVVGEQPAGSAVAGLLLVIAGVIVVVRDELRQGERRPASTALRSCSST